MAILSCDEIWAGRTGGRKRGGVIEFTRVFRLVTDDPLTEQVEVLACGSLPAYGSTYLANGQAWAAAYLDDRTASQADDDPNTWEVVCRYSSRDADKTIAPADRPAKISWKNEYVEEEVAEDLDGEPLVNSAYEPFEIVTHRIPVLVVTVRKNFETWDPAADYEGWIDTTNTETFLDYTVGQVLLDDVSAESNEEDGTEFFERVYVFKCRNDRADPWKSQLLDQGYCYFDATENRQVTAYTLDGQPPQKPQLLDGTGQPLAVWSGAPAVYLQFRLRATNDFNLIGLGV